MLTNLLRTLALLAGLLLSFALVAQPANDDCTNAIDIGSVTDFAFSNIDATTEGPYHPDDCVGGAADSLYNDIWYRYTADFTGTAQFSTCGTANFDTNVAVYAPGASCPPTVDDLLACSEDGAGCDNFTSRAVFDVVSGEVYLLRLGGWGSETPGEEGDGTFTVGEFEPPMGPPNDECINAIELDLGANDSTFVEFSTVDATTSDPFHETGPAGCLETGEPVPYNDVWYSWTATFSGFVEYDNCGTANFDTKIAVYGPDQPCPPDVNSLLACGDDGCPGFTSVVNFQVEEGKTYLFRMGAWSSSATGFGSFIVKRIPPPIIPNNDDCAAYDTAWVSPIEDADDFDPIFMGFTVNGSSQPQVPVPGCIGGNEIADVWYKFNSGNNENITIRFSKVTDQAQFAVDLFDSCLSPTDVNTGPGFCLSTENFVEEFITIEFPNFPGEPTEYFLRISTDLTFNEPGEFFFQLLGEAYDPTNTKEVVLNNFKYFPNPTSDYLNVQFDLETTKATTFEIHNTLGQVVQSNHYAHLASGLQQLEIDVADLQRGVYFLHILMEDGQKTVKFVKE